MDIMQDAQRQLDHDVIEQLSRAALQHCTQKDAAEADLAAARAEMDDLKTKVQFYSTVYDAAEADLAAARAQIVVLAKLHESAAEDRKTLLDELVAARAEVERLREGLRNIHEAHDSYIEHNPAAKKNPDWLDDTIEESRALLSDQAGKVSDNG